LLRQKISDLRLYKQPIEIEIMQFVNDVSSKAHITVMQKATNINDMEYLAEAEFK